MSWDRAAQQYIDLAEISQRACQTFCNRQVGALHGRALLPPGERHKRGGFRERLSDAAPPMSVMKSRRFSGSIGIRSLTRREHEAGYRIDRHQSAGMSSYRRCEHEE